MGARKKSIGDALNNINKSLFFNKVFDYVTKSKSIHANISN